MPGGSGNSDHDEVRELAIVFVLITLFWGYFGVSGVMNERAFELICWVASSVILCLYNLSYIFQSGKIYYDYY